MPPPTKKQRLARETRELTCEFSECVEKCHGVDQLTAHVTRHFNVMKDQFHRAVADTDCDNEEVDNTKCECPWRGCGEVLSVKDNWKHCARHVKFHAFHTYLKAIGDDELQTRKVSFGCTRDEAQRSIIPDLADPLICGWIGCGYEFDCPWTFYKHVVSHAVLPYNRERLKCQWLSCKHVCPTKSNVTKLKDHLRTHTQERKFACSRCGALYCSSIRLVDHQQREATGEKSFQCSHCLKKFFCERILRDHLRKHVNMYGCMFCDMTCPSPSALRIHILYRHSTERPYSCSHCDKLFKTKFDLAGHNVTHEYENYFIACSVENCDYTCKSLVVLRKHMANVHEGYKRVYACHICEELFDNGEFLSRHLKRIHEIKYPAGHVKFRFAPESDGIYRLVTVRYECLTEECDDADSSTLVEEDSIAGVDGDISFQGQPAGSVTEAQAPNVADVIIYQGQPDQDATDVQASLLC